MRTRLDQLAKAILGVLLKQVAHVETGREILGHVEIADLWIEPDERASGARERLGVLGRMMELGPCLIEPFSQVPRIRDIRSCILKQYALDLYQAREAKKANHRPPKFPPLWVLSAGHPESLLEQMEPRVLEGWPRGFYGRSEFDQWYLVVLRLLPETPETLFLRLLGRGVTFRTAVGELLGRPEGEWAMSLLKPVLVAFRTEIAQGEVEEEAMDVLSEIDTIYAEWERQTTAKGREQGRAQGRAQGREQGLTEGIETLCASFGIELSEERRQQLAGWDAPRLKQVLAEIVASRKWPDSSEPR